MPEATSTMQAQPTPPQPPPLDPGADAPLIALAAEARAADADYAEICRVTDDVRDYGPGGAADAALTEAFGRWERAVAAMAAIPAAGPVGIAVKAGFVVTALRAGPTEVERAIADSLATDLARFGLAVPA